MTIGTKLYTYFCGNLVGEDQFGNRYFESKKQGANGRKKRWVMYKEAHEPSAVPPNWHGWLHYTFDKPLTKSYEWQKEHRPNMTGSSEAYFPPGHAASGGQRKKAIGDYQPWQP